MTPTANQTLNQSTIRQMHTAENLMWQTHASWVHEHILHAWPVAMLQDNKLHYSQPFTTPQHICLLTILYMIFLFLLNKYNVNSKYSLRTYCWKKGKTRKQLWCQVFMLFNQQYYCFKNLKILIKYTKLLTKFFMRMFLLRVFSHILFVIQIF